MSRRDKKPKWQYGKPPVYINFPISMFKQLAGECLDVRQFKAMMNDVINYAMAAWYRRGCSAWHDPQEYDGALFSLTLANMGISVNGDKRDFFYDNISPRMAQVTQCAGQAFCGMDKDIIFRYRNNDVSDFECLQFLAYCAIRSILGRGLFDNCFPMPKRITWEFILSRMAGNNKRVPVEDMPPFIAAYAIRRKRDKLRKSLIYKWHVQVDGQSRGKGGAYYMIHDSIPIAQAIEDLKNYKKVARKWRKKGQAGTGRPP